MEGEVKWDEKRKNGVPGEISTLTSAKSSTTEGIKKKGRKGRSYQNSKRGEILHLLLKVFFHSSAEKTISGERSRGRNRQDQKGKRQTPV